MKIVISFSIAFGLLIKLFAQNTPIITDNELIHKEDLTKKIGWIKIKIDSNFRETLVDELAKYEYYDFCNIKGRYASSNSRKLLFPTGSSRITVTKSNPLSTSKLLNGAVDFYDKNNHRIEKYIFKNGFIIKIYGFAGWNTLKKKYKGKLSSIIEYAPENKSLESWGNYFKEDGYLFWDSHEKDNGYTYQHLPLEIHQFQRMTCT